MSESQMTPGPWEVFGPPPAGRSQVVRIYPKGCPDDTPYICEVGHWLGWDTRDANARAIAALPELVEALRGCLTCLENAHATLDAALGQEPSTCDVVATARAALAKLEGGAA